MGEVCRLRFYRDIVIINNDNININKGRPAAYVVCMYVLWRMELTILVPTRARWDKYYGDGRLNLQAVDI